ncbi:MAG: 3-phosphoshikimate 1-carboxyvinyltransferase [Bacilli bacterium]|jgi:3-phosphoshikimate 1-carboxyvinyltransferase
MIRIHPSKNRNKVIVPSSKSLLHRYLFAAALAEGKTVIKNVSFSNDINDSIEFLKLFKKKIKVNKNTIIVYEDKNNNIKNASLIMKDSATTLRLAIPVLGALSNKTIIRTSERLLERPFSVYQDIFLKQKLNFIFGKDKIEFTGPLKAGLYEIPGFISSQFISGLLFALPLLHSDSVLKVIRPIESLSYVNLTLSVLKKAQIKVEKKQNLYLINGNQKYQSFNINCEGDYSQAAFFIGLGLINSKVIIGNFNKNSIQGDKQMIDIVKKLNGNIMEKGNKIIVKPSVLRGGIIDLKDCPDLGPILMVIAATVNDKFEFINASRLRIKESDRVASMEVELKKIGVDIYSTFDSVIINGGINVNQEINFSSHNDHRIFMALAVLATILPFGATITNEECIKKSYPKFIYDLKRMNVLIE